MDYLDHVTLFSAIACTSRQQGGHLLDLINRYSLQNIIDFFNRQHYHKVFLNKKSGFRKTGNVARVSTLLVIWEF